MKGRQGLSHCLRFFLVVVVVVVVEALSSCLVSRVQFFPFYASCFLFSLFFSLKKSVYRGFTGSSIFKYMEHVCQQGRVERCMTIRHMAKRKRCIVEETEISIAGLFPTKVVGLYPSDPPDGGHMWLRNPDYWRELVRTMNFPVSKVNQAKMIGSVSDARLRNCTRFLDWDFLQNYNFTQLKRD